MTISNNTVAALVASVVTVGLVFPAGFSPAWAVESNGTNRGNGDQTQTQTAPRPEPSPTDAPALIGGTAASPPATFATPSASPTPPTPAATPTPPGASRAGLRVGRPKLQFSGKTLIGVASFYGADFHGRRTYTGERFNMYAMTLACRRLPMGTRVRVTNLRNGKSAIARVNDRGPNGRFKSRVADLSKGLARTIGFRDGLTRVKLEVVKK